jgi:hypothetical protein
MLHMKTAQIANIYQYIIFIHACVHYVYTYLCVVCATSERKHLRETWRENCVVYISCTKISREHIAHCLHNREMKAIKTNTQRKSVSLTLISPC